MSDGTEPPDELMRLAASRGLGTVALTDHDTLAGVAAAATEAEALGLEFIPGTELSVDWPTGKMHLLVYFLEPGAGPLQDRLGWLRTGRDRRNGAIVERLNALGYELTMAEVLAAAEGESVGRPHIADVLVERGEFANRDEVFTSLLRDGGPAYIERDRFGAVEAIELARSSDAVPVIAHPYTIGVSRDDYTSAFSELATAGLGGIEAYHTMHQPALRTHLAALADQLGIAATGGSDYHGPGKKEGVDIGVGRGDLRVPESAVDQLHAQRNR